MSMVHWYSATSDSPSPHKGCVWLLRPSRIRLNSGWKSTRRLWWVSGSVLRLGQLGWRSDCTSLKFWCFIIPISVVISVQINNWHRFQPMIPTFVFGWPTSQEKGDYLAVDLGISTVCVSPQLQVKCLYSGGTNLRVCLVTIQGDGKFEITQSKYRLTEEQKQDDGQKLFDFCAECLKIFIDTSLTDPLTMYLGTGGKIPLGFTVSTFIFSFVLWSFLTTIIKVLISLHVSRYHILSMQFIKFHLLLQSNPNRSGSFNPLDERFRRSQYRGPWCSWNVSKITW